MGSRADHAATSAPVSRPAPRAAGACWPLLRRCLLALALCLALLTVPLVAGAADDEETRQLLAAGDKALGNGRAHYAEALSRYTQALVRSPENERGLYSRAQLLSMTNERKAALADLDTLLALSPEHPQALSLRMSLSAHEGHLSSAVRDGQRLIAVYRSAGRAAKAKETEEKVRKLIAYSDTWQRLSAVMDAPLTSHQPAGTDAPRRAQYEECVKLLQAVIQDFASDSVDLRLRRASCALASENHQAASQEVKYVLARDAQHLVAISLNAKALRGLGALDQARSELRRCLAVDPEYAPCARLNKLIRAQQRHLASIEEALRQKKHANAIAEIQQAFDQEGGTPPYAEQLLRWRCEAYVGLRDTAKGVPACEAALLTTGPDSGVAADIRVHIAELYIVDDDLDKAEETAKKAKEIHRTNAKIDELLGKIQSLRRTGARKDYYKILGVKKSASKQDIRRAYRKLARTLHPDQLRSKDMSAKEREKNDNRFRDINEAKEVLMDDDKRARYDSGEDVMNPQATPNQGGPFYGHPFHFQSGGFPGGGFPGGGFPGGGFPGGGFPGGGFPGGGGFPRGGGGGGQQQFFFFRQ